MDYLKTDILTHLREGLLDTCRHHIHFLSCHLKHSSNGLYQLGQRLNEKVSIRSRRLLHSPPTEDDVVNQAKVLCRDYAYVKLRKHKLLSRDIYGKAGKRGPHQLQFLRQKAERDAQSGQVKTRFGDHGIGPSDVSKELIKVATEFEKCFPYLYEDITEQLQLNFQSPANILSVYNTVGADIFRKGITWARIVALYTLTGALIVECVKQGQHGQANALVDALQKLVRKRLARWIIDQGGWIGLVVHFRQKQSSITVLRVLSLVGLLLGVVLVFWCPKRT